MRYAAKNHLHTKMQVDNSKHNNKQSPHFSGRTQRTGAFLFSLFCFTIFVCMTICNVCFVFEFSIKTRLISPIKKLSIYTQKCKCVCSTIILSLMNCEEQTSARSLWLSPHQDRSLSSSLPDVLQGFATTPSWTKRVPQFQFQLVVVSAAKQKL